MNILRKAGNIQLNQGNQMANGLFNVSDNKNNVSIWFDEDLKDELLSLSDEEFTNKANELFEI